VVKRYLAQTVPKIAKEQDERNEIAGRFKER